MLTILDRQMKRSVEAGTVEIFVGDSSTQTLGVALAVKP
jgi:hypothetical protein